MYKYGLIWLLSIGAYVCAGGTVVYADSLRGHVRDQDGAAVAGARVTATSASGTFQTLTSSTGAFGIDGVSFPANLNITAEGFETVTAHWTEPGPLSIVLHPASISQEIVVTATRSEVALGDVAASVSRIGPEEFATTPALQVDNVLRQVPGFSLFRRSDSRTANPTSQGVSLRGLGASGASRALVLYDGVPLNDPFGGWVYWNRVPIAEVNSVEVLRGGASALYGSGALAGVVSIRGEEPGGRALAFDSSAGGQDTGTAGIAYSDRLGPWGVAGTIRGFRTEGYVPVPAQIRGAVDAPANVRYGAARITIDRRLQQGTMFISGNLFNESRQNGTELQTNSTRLAELTTGADHSVAGGSLAVRLFGSAQRFNQTFSSVAADRTTESLVREQAVPAQQVGASAQWVRALAGNNVLAVGADFRQVRGHADEMIWIGGVPTTNVLAGGRQMFGGAFVEDMLRIGSQLHVTGALRVDSWRNYEASSTTIPIAGSSSVTERAFPSRTNTRLSPSIGAVLRLTPIVSVTGSAYSAFRSPTLNELYRGFRLGNVQTLANDELRAERLRGWEAGLNIGSGPVFARATFFWNSIDDAVGNRTLETTPTLITRQRQNIGVLRSRGLEVEARANLPWNLWVRAAYEHAQATVASSLEPVLVGLRIPQVPRNMASAELGYLGKRWTSTVVGRYVGQQFDDDINRFLLPGYFTTDAFVGYRVTNFAEVFLACENILDRTYEIGRTPVPSLGSPRLARAGIRLRWAKSK
ncbi:MAG TPA: TonB-dependent receptor [Terriglobales bacterium]|nr:TonB-dependent receptor [Terriglobales bacterium]